MDLLTARLSVLSWLAPCPGHPSPECQTRPSCQQGHVLECTAALPDPEDPRLRSVGQWPASHVPDARARAGRECGRSTAKEQTQFCLRLTGEGAKLRHCRSSSRQPGVGGRGGAAGRQMRFYRPAPPPGRGGPEMVPVSSPSPGPDKVHSPQGLCGGSTKNAKYLNARLMI